MMNDTTEDDLVDQLLDKDKSKSDSQTELKHINDLKKRNDKESLATIGSQDTNYKILIKYLNTIFEVADLYNFDTTDAIYKNIITYLLKSTTKDSNDYKAILKLINVHLSINASYIQILSSHYRLEHSISKKKLALVYKYIESQVQIIANNASSKELSNWSNIQFNKLVNQAAQFAKIGASTDKGSVKLVKLYLNKKIFNYGAKIKYYDYNGFITDALNNVLMAKKLQIIRHYLHKITTVIKAYNKENSIRMYGPSDHKLMVNIIRGLDSVDLYSFLSPAYMLSDSYFEKQIENTNYLMPRDTVIMWYKRIVSGNLTNNTYNKMRQFNPKKAIEHIKENKNKSHNKSSKLLNVILYINIVLIAISIISFIYVMF